MPAVAEPAYAPLTRPLTSPYDGASAAEDPDELPLDLGPAPPGEPGLGLRRSALIAALGLAAGAAVVGLAGLGRRCWSWSPRGCCVRAR